MDVTFRRFLCCRGHLQIWTGWWWDEFLHGWNESAYFCTQLYAPKSWWSMRGTMIELCQICVLLVEIAFWAMAVGSTSSELVPAKWTYVLVGLCNLLWHWRGPTNMHSWMYCLVRWCTENKRGRRISNQPNVCRHPQNRSLPFLLLLHSFKKSTLLYGRWNRPWKILPQRLFFSLKTLVPQGRCMGVGNWRIPLVYEGHSYFNHFLQIAIWPCYWHKSVGCDVHCSNNRWAIWCTFAHHVFIVAARRVISNRNRSKSGETWTNSSCHILLSPLRRALEWLGASP